MPGRRRSAQGRDAPPLRKALGQHHLVDGALCRPLIQFLSLPSPDLEGRRVLEIGPGGGVLTRELLAAGARVWGWELDPSLPHFYPTHFTGAISTLRNGYYTDFRELDPARLAPGHGKIVDDPATAMDAAIAHAS